MDSEVGEVVKAGTLQEILEAHKLGSHNNWLDTIFNQLPLGAFIVDIEEREGKRPGEILIANQEAERITGYEVSGEKELYMDTQFRHDLETLMKIWEEVKGMEIGEKSRTYETQITVKGRGKKWVKVDGIRLTPTLYLGTFNDITDRKIAEERVLLATLAARIGIWELDITNRKYHVDHHMGEILGYTAKELPNKVEAWASLIHEDDRKKAADAAVRYMKGEADIYELEYRVRKKDGYFRWFRTIGRIERDEAGKATRMYGVHMDVTEKKEAEKALMIVGEANRKIIEGMKPDGYFRVDVHGSFIEGCNDSLAKIWGAKDVSEIIGFNFREYTEPESSRIIERRFNKIFNGEDDEEGPYIKYKITKLDRTEAFIEVATWLYMEDGHRKGFQGIVRDVTERTKAEELLRKSEERYRKLLDDSPIAIFIHEYQKDKVIYANRATAELIGDKSPANIAGTSLYDYLHEDEKEAAKILINTGAREDRATKPTEHRIMTRTGEVRYVETIASIVDWQGKKAQMEAMRDITDLKKAYASLAESEERFKQMSYLLPSPVVEMSLDGTIEWVNEAGLKMFGYEKLPGGVNCLDFVAEKDKGRATSNLTKLLNWPSDADAESHPYVMIAKGEEKFVKIKSVVRRNKEGVPTGFRGVIDDITEIELKNKELEAKHSELEKAYQYLEEQSNAVNMLNQRLRLRLQEMFKVASEDQFTGFFRQDHFLEWTLRDAIKDDIAQGREKGQPDEYHFIYIDIDDFRRFNEKYDHDLGADYTLKKVTEVIKNVLPGTQYKKVRSGHGEEFLVLMRKSSDEEVLEAAEKIRGGIQNLETTVGEVMDFYRMDKMERSSYLKTLKDNGIICPDETTAMPVTVTIGVYSTKDLPDEAIHNIVSEDSIEARKKLVTYADRAMKMGKKNGKNQVVWSKLSMETNPLTRQVELAQNYFRYDNGKLNQIGNREFVNLNPAN